MGKTIVGLMVSCVMIGTAYGQGQAHAQKGAEVLSTVRWSRASGWHAAISKAGLKWIIGEDQ
jgi:hypothetical protein